MKITGLPIADMTKEEEFEKWWTREPGDVRFVHELSAKKIWDVAWCTATQGQWEATKYEALSEIKESLFAEATSAFLDGDDGEALLLRRLANRIATWNK